MDYLAYEDVLTLCKRDAAMRLRPDHKLAVVQDMTVAERVRLARSVLQRLTQLAGEGAKAA